MTPKETELYQYIEENRPEMLLDPEGLKIFIRERAADSAREYETHVQGGSAPQSAEEAARMILYENLNYSPCQIIQDIIEENYRVTAHPTILVSCYLAVKNILDEYPATDEFLSSPDYDILCERLIHPVVLFIREKEIENFLETGVGKNN